MGDSPQQPGARTGAVFLSYASEDTEAARRICAALSAGGIEVWFDQSELRGGDMWDQRIRREIHECTLFIPVVSRHTQERLEGYFRREWKLAIERTHDMAEQKAFLVPVVVDDTGDRDAIVPDLFKAVQWTRLPGGEAAAGFVERVQRLLSAGAPVRSAAGVSPAATATAPVPAQPARKLERTALVAVAVVIAGVVGYFAVDKLRTQRPASPAAAAAAAATAAATTFTPPPHSVAVLPFVNMSGDKEQEYFSEGLTEEIRNSLTEINELQVAGRTSAFSFRGTETDVGTIARKLNVGAVLEGSVRRSGNTVRITAQLVNAVSGFHLWSKTYDRDLKDVLKLQTEIATAVASALKVTLLGNEAARIELGGTHNAAAFDAYLRGTKALRGGQGAAGYQSAIAAYSEAIRLDPNYALAIAGRSLATLYYAGEFAAGADVRVLDEKGEADARLALKLAPNLAEAHMAMGRYLASTPLDYPRASEAYERAMALAPGDADVLAGSGQYAVYVGQLEAGLAALRRAVALDPLNPRSRAMLGEAFFWARRYQEAVATLGEVMSLEPDFRRAYGFRGVAYYLLGDLQSARATCESEPDHWSSQWCLAVTYQRLGRHADAEAQFKKLQTAFGDASAYQCASIYAAWGDKGKALESLSRAVQLPDPGVIFVKNDPLMDPLRGDPQFQAIVGKLKFPD